MTAWDHLVRWHGTRLRARPGDLWPALAALIRSLGRVVASILLLTLIGTCMFGSVAAALLAMDQAGPARSRYAAFAVASLGSAAALWVLRRAMVERGWALSLRHREGH